MTKKEKIVFIALAVFVLLPNLMGVVMASDLLNFGQRILYLITSLCIYALGLCVFKRRTFFYVVSSWFLLSAVEIVHLIINHATTSMLFIFTCIKSEKGEFLELLSTYWFVVLIFFAIWGVYFYLNRRFIQNEYIAPHVWRMGTMLTIAAFFTIAIIMLGLRPKFRNMFNFREMDYRTAAWVGCEKACPVNMVLGTYHIVSLALEINKQEKALADFRFGATYQASASVEGDNRGRGLPRTREGQTPIVVFLIGETSRYDHWQINGYARSTSPCLMARREQIISFDSVYTIGNLTTVCVPYILSRATPDNPRLYYRETSVVDAFHEAGYSTAWIADQSFNNEFLMRIANGCNYAKYIADDGTEEVFTDTVLLAPLQKVLTLSTFDKDRSVVPSKGNMIVLHSLGCHFKYSERYPDAFQRFTPDMKGINIRDMFRNIDEEAEGFARLKPENMAVYQNLKTILTNSYDNAILFTDYFIDRVIRELEATRRPAVLVYVGDHGENLLDDERNMFLHGTYSGSAYEYHVPLFVWASPEYAATHADQLAAMRANTNKCISTMTLFHSLLDLGDVSCPQLDAKMCISRPELEAQDTIYGFDANMQRIPLPTK